MQLFKAQYTDGTIDTEVISNVLQPFHMKKYPEMKDYLEMIYPYDKSLSNKELRLTLFAVNNYASKFTKQALKELYGKPDFTFEGNRTYKNYVFEFEGLTIISPLKRSFVLSEGDDWKPYIDRLIRFEKHYTQQITGYALSNIDKLIPEIQDSISLLKNAGVISEDNQINFDYFARNKAVKSKPNK